MLPGVNELHGSMAGKEWSCIYERSLGRVCTVTASHLMGCDAANVVRKRVHLDRPESRPAVVRQGLVGYHI